MRQEILGGRIRFWFQNLNESGKRWFEFRGAIYSGAKTLFSYSAWSGPSLKLQYTHGSNDGEKSTIYVGLGFMTLCFSVNLPESWYFKRKCIATWDNNREFYLTDGREYGFYFYNWAFVWHWHKKVNESGGKQPWYRDIYFHIDDFFLGKTEYFTRDLTDVENVKFKLGGKEFTMNSIKWMDATWFRRRIPIALYAQRMVKVDMKIDKPPMRAGKGENSWDCGDDGTFGSHGPWRHVRPTWMNRAEIAKLAVEDYVKSVLKDAKKYGRGDGEQGISAADAFEYIGMEARKEPTAQSC